MKIKNAFARLARPYLEAKAKDTSKEAVCKCSWQPEWKLRLIIKVSDNNNSIDVVVCTVKEDTSIDWSADTLKREFAMSLEDRKSVCRERVLVAV